MRGRKPSLKILTETAEQSSATVSIPKPPASLTPEAAAEYQRVARLLKSLGLITPLDRTALAVYATAWGQWVECQSKIAELGLVVRGSNGGAIQNPYVAIANQATKTMQSLLSEFGLSPAARRRLLAGSNPKTTKPSGQSSYLKSLAE